MRKERLSKNCRKHGLVNTFGLPAYSIYFVGIRVWPCKIDFEFAGCQENFTTPFRMLKNSLSGRLGMLRIPTNQESGLMDGKDDVNSDLSLLDQLVFIEVVAMYDCLFVAISCELLYPHGYHVDIMLLPFHCHQLLYTCCACCLCCGMVYSPWVGGGIARRIFYVSMFLVARSNGRGEIPVCLVF